MFPHLFSLVLVLLMAAAHGLGSAEAAVRQGGVSRVVEHETSDGEHYRFHCDFTARTAHVDFEGRKSQSSWNARQQLAEVRRGEARYRFSWDATGRLLARHQPDGIEQRYRYGKSGELFERLERGVASDGAKMERITRYVWDRAIAFKK